MVKYNYIVVLLCVVFIVSSCFPQKKNDNEGTVVNDEMQDFTTETEVLNSSTNAEADASNDNTVEKEKIAINTETKVFPDKYTTILNWSTIRIGQEGADISIVEQEKEYISLLQKNVAIGYTYPFFIPYDTVSGSLENIKTQNDSTRKILNILKLFFNDITNNSIDANIGKYVLADEIPVIIRQVAFSQDYGQNITEYRVGNIATAQQDRLYTNVRVFAQFLDFKSRVELIMYFNFLNGNWFISAIEGDINELLVPYTTSIRFEPSGTTGISQGF